MNWRDVLRMAAAATAPGLPAPGLAQTSGPGPIMSALSTYMGAAGARALPTEITEHAKYHLLDTLASMISGTELLPGQAAGRYIREHGAKGTATDRGFCRSRPPRSMPRLPMASWRTLTKPTIRTMNRARIRDAR